MQTVIKKEEPVVNYTIIHLLVQSPPALAIELLKQRLVLISKFGLKEGERHFNRAFQTLMLEKFR